MEYAEMKEKVRVMKKDVEEMLSAPGLEPFVAVNLESVYSHLYLLSVELCLDIEE